MNINQLSISDLKKAVTIKEKIEALNQELNAILGNSAKGAEPARKKGGMSAAGRERIAAAQRARWAKINAAKGKPAKLK
ncbi:MAG: hypothetical protein ACTHLW_08570 [Verrucomicrobiota bacterium]